MPKPELGLLIGIGGKPKKPGADAMSMGGAKEASEPADEGRAMACQALRRALEGDDDEELMSAFKEMLAYADEAEESDEAEDAPQLEV
jgi:hypothetical protein